MYVNRSVEKLAGVHHSELRRYSQQPDVEQLYSDQRKATVKYYDEKTL